MFPKFLLRKLYVKKSLTIVDEKTFTFRIKNNIGKAILTNIGYIKVNGEDIELEDVNALSPEEGKILKASDINSETKVNFPKGSEVEFTINKGLSNEEGKKHKIEVSFTVKGLGKLKFDFSDEVVS